MLKANVASAYCDDSWRWIEHKVLKYLFYKKEKNKKKVSFFTYLKSSITSKQKIWQKKQPLHITRWENILKRKLNDKYKNTEILYIQHQLLPATSRKLNGERRGQVTSSPYIIRCFTRFYSFFIQNSLSVCSFLLCYPSCWSKFVRILLLCPRFQSFRLSLTHNLKQTFSN